MSLLNKRYADYFNTKYSLVGHLFEKRFFSDVILTDEAILYVSRYIHRNPLKAGMVTKLEDYSWSSFAYITGKESQLPPYIYPDIFLRYFGGTLEEKIEKYVAFCYEEI